jgi:tRNA-specific 2-thiouridylase
VLGVLTTEQLQYAMFPLGDTPKPEVRREAARRGLLLADKPDSHDICFIADGDTAGFLHRKLAAETSAAGAGGAGGDIIDAEGNRLGSHDGVFGFTVGQRKGLRIGTPAADGRPRYVLEVSPVTRTVTVGTAEDLDVRRIVGVRPRWCASVPVGAVECLVQVRAHGEPLPAVVQVRDDGSIDIELLAPARGVAPGQAAVIYEGTRVLGSATIDRTYR